MTFREFVPAPWLRAYVARYWLVETMPSDAHPLEHLLTPNALDGFVFQFQTQAPSLFVQAAACQALPSAYALLQPFAPWRLHLPGPCGIAGVFFRPGVVHRCLRYPMHELTHQPLDLEAFLGPPVRQLQAQLQEAPSPAARVQLLDAFISHHLPVLAQPLTYSDYVLQQLAQHPGTGSIQALARELGVSRQFLARHFAEQVGRSPKQMSRVVRFNALHQTLVQTPSPNWLDLVYQFNYYDQAHLIKDFAAFTGLSPTTYQHAPSAAADFYAGKA
ncbi:helix-turn-helix domain-containing protein [Hymenobacter crusticola]|uniref:HTH araC/xylS-type domain-containing protein n=1 Tax=Hymenobacter crusticola TaxID=1770526 RepID=A0A243W6J6_9BACT|nr:helix-turn-helix domain-containing protein [Hymenobacter crusticola]OUJ69782.1 hypothetical protein BXP70_26080 [Hymenobacter crusticola]